ncbi:hypothetical protein ACH5RR_008431 [Cinchona calisaya]|uniref:RNase H type-1 domain-containing protein n=1 Tax=Cinchona calisaya TaxID=153742 RepID=A0ABD3ABK4_9GENT
MHEAALKQPFRRTTETHLIGLHYGSFFTFAPQAIRSAALVSWKKPKSPMLKLNIDGSSIGNPGPSGRRVCRDQRGVVLIAFAKHFDQGTSMEAKMKSLLFVLELCVHMVFYLWRLVWTPR